MSGIVIHDRGLVYWNVPKCACTSVKAWLGRYLGFSFSENREVHDLPFERTRDWQSYPDYFHFAVRRPALDRIYSLWKDKVKPDQRDDDLYHHGLERGTMDHFYPRMHGGMSFEALVWEIVGTDYWDADPHFLPQRLCRPSSNIYLVSMSDLDREMNKLASLFSMPKFSECRHRMLYTLEERDEAIEGLSSLTKERFRKWESLEGWKVVQP